MFPIKARNIFQTFSSFLHSKIIFLTVAGLTIFSFILVNSLATNKDYLLDNDVSRDIIYALHISKYNLIPDPPPRCEGCYTFPFLKNSKAYYYLLSFIYPVGGANGIIIFCYVWVSLLVPLIYFLTVEISNSKFAGIFSSLIVSLAPIVQMPYQPHFLPTLSCLLVWMLLVNQRKKSVLLNILSGLILVIGIQIHLSFLLLIPFYIFYTLNLWYQSNKTDKTIMTIFAISIFIVIIFANIQTEYIPFDHTNRLVNISTFFRNLTTAFKLDLLWFFPIKIENITLFGFIIFLIVKKQSVKRLLPILLLYPIAGFYSSNIIIGNNYSFNSYTTIFWPIIVAIVSSSIILLNNKLSFLVFCSVFYILLSDISLSVLRFPSFKPVKYSENRMTIISNKINLLLNDSEKNIVLEFDGGVFNLFTGYYLYQEILENKLLMVWPEISATNISPYADESINKIVYCIADCQRFRQEYLPNNTSPVESDVNFMLFKTKTINLSNLSN